MAREPQRACIMSPCATRVGKPVLAATLNITDHAGCFSAATQTDIFHHQKRAGPRCAGHGLYTTPAAPRIAAIEAISLPFNINAA